MRYELTVNMIEPNPNYANELSVWQLAQNERQRSYGSMGEPWPEKPSETRLARALFVTLTEDEWRAVKSAAVQAMVGAA